MSAVLFGRPVVAQHFDVTDSGNGGRVGGDEAPNICVFGLGRVDDNIAVEQHYSSRPGNGLSMRICRSHHEASVPVRVPP